MSTQSEKLQMLLAEVGVAIKVSANGHGSAGDPRTCDPRVVLKAYNIAHAKDLTMGEYIANLKAAHPERAYVYDLWCQHWGVDLAEVA